jgi:hypothetical protein
MSRTQISKNDVQDKAISPAKISDITPSANQIPYLSGADTFAADGAKLGFNGTNLGVGKVPGTERIEVNGAIKIGSAVGNSDGTIQYSSGFQGYKSGSWSSMIFGGGTSGYVSRFTGSVDIGNSVIQDNGTNIGIGTSPGSDKLTVNGTINATNFYGGGPGIDGRGVILVTGDYSPTAAQSGSTLVMTTANAHQRIFLPAGTAGLNFVVAIQQSKVASSKWGMVIPYSGEYLQIGITISDAGGTNNGGLFTNQSGAVITLICLGNMASTSGTQPVNFPGGVVWFATSQGTSGVSAGFVWSRITGSSTYPPFS